MKKKIDYYLLNGEIIDTRLFISDDYINYYNRYFVIFFGIIIIITLITGIAFINSFMYDYPSLLFILFFIFSMGLIIFMHGLNNFQRCKCYEYYITNKRVIFFDRWKRKIKALNFDEIEYIDIKKVKIDFNHDINIDDPKNKNKVVENVRFYNIDSVDFPYMIFWYLKDATIVNEVINKYRSF